MIIIGRPYRSRVTLGAKPKKTRSLLFRAGVTAVLSLFQLGTVNAESSYFIRDVTVIPMDAERQIANQNVLISNGEIAAIGSGEHLKPPRRATVVDGRGKYLMPGLADMHAHIYGGFTPDDQAATAPIAKNQLLLYAASGVTFIRDAGGTPAHFDYDEKAASGEWIAPDLFTASPILEGERNVWDFTVKVTDPAEAERLVGEYAQAGYWGVKVYHTVSPEVYAAIISAAQEQGLSVMGHVPFDVGIDAVLVSGQSSIEHFRGYDFDGVDVASLWSDGGRSKERFSSWNSMSEARKQELIDATVKNDVWNAPTLAVNRLLFDEQQRGITAGDERLAAVHPALRSQLTDLSGLDAIFSPESKTALADAYPVMLDFLRRLHEAGAGVLVGTDSVVAGYVPGFTVIDEIESFAEAGLSNYAALSAATRAPAEYLGIDADRGTVAVGKRADLILVNADPLDDVTALWDLYGVFLNGQWHPSKALEKALYTSASGETP